MENDRENMADHDVFATMDESNQDAITDGCITMFLIMAALLIVFVGSLIIKWIF